MTKRIFRSIFFTALGVFLLGLALTMRATYTSFEDGEIRQLASLARACARGVESAGETWLTGMEADGYRITLLDADGNVRYDSEADADRMENHRAREEVQKALQTGEGESARYSATLLEKTYYKAIRLADGGVVRVSIAQYSVLMLLLNMLGPVCLACAAVLALSYCLSKRLAGRVTEPLNRLNLDEPLKSDAYEELAPLLTRIDLQHREIANQQAELRRKRVEFDAITGSMAEGLIFLNADGEILSVNRAAARLFGADEDCIGKRMLALERSSAMQRLLSAVARGQRAEETIPLAGGLWRAETSPVITGEKVAGACLLLVEVTQKAKLEQMRREFSANVTHELKTPLQTILGASELMENGMVKPEDAPDFVRRIHAEAARLVTLIDDILRLSRLDEGAGFESENVNLLEVAREAIGAVSAAAAERNITLCAQGDEAVVPGVKRLIYDIAYNLADNAVKYNVDGGSVCLRVEDGWNEARLSAVDTGIGIPPEHQSRVFERFYRVDKSHSRATGGTGLGLSIVKHAAQYLSASVSLESEPEKGTRVDVVFPKNPRPEK